MTNARPNALRLAVAVAISSSIIGTQALTDRKLQTKSIDFRCSGQVEFTQSEVTVQPTLGDDQQPVPNSFTTTYPDQTVKVGSFAHTKGFTDALADVDGGISSVELFETGEKDVAVKYTKVLKMGDEGVFRFTHNLEEKELVIEVRGGMTDQDSVAAVRDQLVGIQSLEPLTKIASPRQLAGVLKAAGNRAGSLGTIDHYVALATIEIEKVEVNGRTFMSLIASSEQPPELQRLGQSLFINDEALLAAATSAYIQVHILGEDIQQQALNELLAYSKPVGYVVNIEDDKRVYPVPVGYPMLKVKEAPGEIIVFYGQIQNPHDIAFIESFHKHWLEIKGNSPAPALTTQVKKYKFKSYLYIIRSRQMELLENFIARLESGVNTDKPTTISIEEKMSTIALLYYESLQQALNTVITNRAYGTDEFEFTLEHIRIVSSVITPTWMHNQLVKNFCFQSGFRNLLINAHFIQNIHNEIPAISNINQAQTDTSGEDEKFASKVMKDMMTRQLLEFYNNLAKLRAKEAKLGELNEKLLRANEQVEETKAIAAYSDKEKLREKQLFDDRLELLSIRLKYLENQNEMIRREVSQVTCLKQQVDEARTVGEKARVNIKEFYELLLAVISTPATRVTGGQSDTEAIKAKLANIEDQLGITPVNENNLFERFKSIQEYLQETAESSAVEELPVVGRVSQDIINEADLEAPHQAIEQHPGEEEAQVDRQHFQQRSFRTDTTREAEIKSKHTTIAVRLHIQDFDKDADVFVQHENLIQKINTMNDEKVRLRQQLETMNVQQEQPHQRVQRSSDHRNIYNSGDEDVLVATLGVELNDNTTAEELDAMELAINMTLYELTRLKEIMDRTLAPKTTPEILSTLKKVERVLKDDHLSDEDDVYLHRQIISEGMQKYIIEARELLEEDALIVLEVSEKLFNININEGDDKAARLERVHKRLDGDDISAYELDEMDKILWGDFGTTRDDQRGRDLRLKLIHPRLQSLVEVSEERVNELQSHYLTNVEWELEIDPRRSVAAIEKSEAFTTKLANDLQVEFENDFSLSEKQRVLVVVAWALLGEVLETYGDESVKRDRNNEIAHQLNIEGYQDDAAIDDQILILRDKLMRIGTEIYKAGQLDVNGRIEAIEDELDRQMAPLGAKPRYALDRELAVARQALQETESEPEATRQKLDVIGRRQWVSGQSRTHLQPVPDEDETSLNQAMKQIQTEWGLATGDEQTLSERVNDIEHFLRGCSAEKRDEVIEKATKVLNIQITGEHGLLEEAEYLTANKAYIKTHDRDAAHAVDDELPLTRKKYNQVTNFLREHDRKSAPEACALQEEAVVREILDHEKKAFINSGNTDEIAKTEYKNEIAMLDLVLDQKSEAVSIAKKALANQEAIPGAAEKALGLKPDPADTNKQRVNALRNKQVQLGGHDGTGGKTQQLIQEQNRLEGEIEARQADTERRMEVLKAAEEAIENDGGPFQRMPRPVKVLTDSDTFKQHHSLKQQALDAALGLAESAVNKGKTIPCLTAFDFNDEFAPIRLRALVGDDLTFNQASRIVEVFKNLKTSSPPTPFEPTEDQPQNVIEEVQNLAHRARNEIKTGAPQYNDEIRRMGKKAIHFVEHESVDLKGFSEYFATHSVSGNKIITLLREGLISKIELENYMKAVRDVHGYQTVDEFEHFLGYRNGVNVPHFKAVVRMLSDKAAEEFIQSAFTAVSATATAPSAMKESVAGMKEYAVAVIANYFLDDIAFDSGRRTAAFLANVQDTLTPYANAAGLSESELIKVIHGTLMQAHAAVVENQLNDYWLKPSAFLVQAVTWYYSSYKPLLTTHTKLQAAEQSLLNMSFLYLLDLTNRGDYLHRMLTPFQHWLERFGVDPDRTGQYAYHGGIESVSEVGGLAMPLGKAASSVTLLRTGSMLFARQYNANPHIYRSIARLVPEIVKSMGSGQGVQVPLLHRMTPQNVKTLASATAGLVLGPVATVGTYAHGLISGFTYAQTFGFALASSLTFDFFMNDNKLLTQWLGGPLGRSLDRINRWMGAGETQDEYLKRTTIATPQRFSENDEDYSSRVKANNTMYGWTRHENYLQFRERRDRTMKLFENSWEKYFRENVPKWSFSHAESIPYFYTLGAFSKWRQGDDKKVQVHDKKNASPIRLSSQL
ncbi:hypothetical protein [Endozoicomonas sp. 8E]|uniref:hypothetical protein n=1 Tax=Endozoicomonas sp. 8E TaxID=3035692 RepID=UPI002938CF95|nr:hypothetical protein [Endozoicomonas sp. 8E]WOG29617.1 hypothetical protein P6910_08175 [Endozoicomonas sp. 8E]